MMSCIPIHPPTHNSAAFMGFQTKYSSNIQANNSNRKLLIQFFFQVCCLGTAPTVQIANSKAVL